MASEQQVVLVDAQGREEVSTMVLHSDERLILVGGALFTRQGMDDEGRKRFVFERVQKP